MRFYKHDVKDVEVRTLEWFLLYWVWIFLYVLQITYLRIYMRDFMNLVNSPLRLQFSSWITFIQQCVCLCFCFLSYFAHVFYGQHKIYWTVWVLTDQNPGYSANNARSRLLRLSEAAERFRRQAAISVRTGKENDARELLFQKKKIMQAMEKSKSRIELLDELAAKLNEVWLDIF